MGIPIIFYAVVGSFALAVFVAVSLDSHLARRSRHTVSAQGWARVAMFQASESAPLTKEASPRIFATQLLSQRIAEVHSRFLTYIEELLFTFLKRTHVGSSEMFKLSYQGSSLAAIFLKTVSVYIIVSFILVTQKLWFLTPIILVALIFIGSFALGRKMDSQQRIFNTQLISFSEVVSSALGSGLSLLQAFQLASQENKEPLKTFTEALFREVALGVSPDSAFEHCAQFFGQSELKSLASSLKVQYRLGGNIRTLFEEYTSQGRRNMMFAQSLKAQTAQGRLSTRLVGVVPLVLLIIMNFLMPGYFDYFFSSSTGQILFALAISLNIVGFVSVSKITKMRI